MRVKRNPQEVMKFLTTAPKVGILICASPKKKSLPFSRLKLTQIPFTDYSD
jgi:hypothetical protein